MNILICVYINKCFFVDTCTILIVLTDLKIQIKRNSVNLEKKTYKQMKNTKRLKKEETQKVQFSQNILVTLEFEM